MNLLFTFISLLYIYINLYITYIYIYSKFTSKKEIFCFMLTTISAISSHHLLYTEMSQCYYIELFIRNEIRIKKISQKAEYLNNSFKSNLNST